jgi:hypothetical protein
VQCLEGGEVQVGWRLDQKALDVGGFPSIDQVMSSKQVFLLHSLSIHDFEVFVLDTENTSNLIRKL